MEENLNIKVRKTLIKSNKGDFYASYNLFEIYTSGRLVAKDNLKANYYLERCIEQLRDKKIEVSQLHLLNYKLINEFKFILNSGKVQVLVGKNGSGKTTVLESMAISLSWLIQRMLHKNGQGREIDKTDLNINSEIGYGSILLQLNFNKKNTTRFELCETALGNPTKKKSHYADFHKLANIYKIACEKDSNFNLPILSYYDVTRTNDVANKDIDSFNDVNFFKLDNRFDGYANSLNGKTDFKSFVKWYYRIDQIVKDHLIESNDYKNKNVKELIDKYLNGKVNEDNLIDLLQELDDPKDNILSQKNDTNRNKAVFWKGIIDEVIFKFMDGFDKLTVEYEQVLKLSIEKNGTNINILQLSQGEKTLLALVLDISRRMIILNPQSDNPLKTSGIVLIDEIDLHLHPAWQRKILGKLGDIFPNCQFIVSTHSPQILSEVKYNDIFILQTNDENKFEAVQPIQSYGLTTNQILNEIMNFNNEVLDRSPVVQFEIDKIFEAISEGCLSEAQERIRKLEEDLNGEIPEILSAKFDISFMGDEEK
ncbi:AAA family ATPase [Rosenbergiella epipactidis]|uniref:AAA family ATPase n=1 Tax=Rosenbergiella epipactidis TaxID=1544694 RepID=UPI001F4D6A0A|nr:AAA family ATPase [Rosenbergiella epipactidis]